jgi:proteasome lid subunit RPN8/RPN11
MITPTNIISIFEDHGLPASGVFIDFLPTHDLIRNLTVRFGVEFAVMFTNSTKYYFLYKGTHNSVELPLSKDEILLNHSHPSGTPHPSIHDITWLKLVQDMGSPQVQSVILPIGKNRTTFNIYTPTY